mmetsp:Transcript_47332/g.93389  ORF Transcript_47332/g.93389 Transcript_47332/m.93389 type:complete len:112 (+) Transcript_47332:652-987(+)
MRKQKGSSQTAPDPPRSNKKKKTTAQALQSFSGRLEMCERRLLRCVCHGQMVKKQTARRNEGSESKRKTRTREKSKSDQCANFLSSFLTQFTVGRSNRMFLLFPSLDLHSL